MHYHHLGILGAIVAALSGLYYIYTIIAGNTRPNRITWGVWSLIGFLGAAAVVQGGAKAGSYVPIVYVAMEVIVFALSLTKKYGKPGGEPYDYPLGIIAGASILLWYFASLPPSFAATVAVVGDGIGLWVTLRESWRQPETESVASWASGVLAGSLAIPAIATYNYSTLAYPVYLVIGELSVTVILLIRRQQLGIKNKKGMKKRAA